MARSLVVQTSFLGDTILTTPLLAYLTARDPAPPDVVVTAASAALLANHPAAGEIIVFDKRGRDRGVRGFLRLARALRARRYDAAFLAQGSVRSGALAFAARIPRRVGFATSAGRRFYTARVPNPDGEHHASRLLRLGMQGTGEAPSAASLRPRLYPGVPERAAVDALLAANGWLGESFVVLAPGSVWGTKRWPYYTSLPALLSGSRFVVAGARADAELARGISGVAPDRVLDATGRLSLLASAELIGRAAAIVTNDSSPLHLASAMDTPTLAIFGPTVPEFGFAPLAARATVLGHPDLVCRPCSRHGPQRCPLGHWRCMREITAEYVAGVLRELLEGPRTAPFAPGSLPSFSAQPRT